MVSARSRRVCRTVLSTFAVGGICVIVTMMARPIISAQTTSPVAHYLFDEGIGTTAADASGRGHVGTLIGATGLPQWTSGVRNGALFFDGADDSVRVSSGIISGSALDVSGRNRTYSAWVQWNGNYTKYIVGSNDSAAHFNGLYTTNSSNQGRFRMAIDGGTYPDVVVVCAAVTPAAGRWYHVAGTWDGSVARIYVDGTPCNTSLPGTTDYNVAGDSLHIGSSRGSTGFWRGEIDDVRIFDRALTSEEVQALYTLTEVVPPDATPPQIAITSPAGGAVVAGTVTVSAGATDDVGVAGVQFMVDGVNLGAEDTVEPYTAEWDSSAAPNGLHTFAAVARDAAGNLTTAAQVVVSVENAVDAAPPVLSNIAAVPATTAATITWSTDEAADTQVEYGATLGFGSLTPLGSALVTSHSQSLEGLTANTAYFYRVHSRDALGNAAVSADQTFTTLATATTGPIADAHYAFDEGTGTTTADASGNGNTATITGAGGPPQWTSGIRGSALYFDGVDDSVRVGSGIVGGSVLDLSGRNRSYAAWVQWNSNYSKHIVVSNDSAAHLNGLVTMNSSNQGRFRFVVDGGTFADASAICTAVTPAAGRWYHVAGTWDGSVARIYVDGAACNASAPATTDYNMGGDALHIGSSRGSSGFWRGEIDDVRIYGRALTAAEVQALYTMADDAAVTDTTAPAVVLTSPVGSAAVGDLIAVSADASDDTGVSGVQFTVNGVNLGAEDTTAPYSTVWDTRAVPNGPHTLAAVARDAAGNLTTAAGVAVSVQNLTDTTPPALSSIQAAPSTTTATISWSTDEASDTQVEYGTSAAFGSTTVLSTTLVTTHSQALTGLTPNTPYSYRVRSRDGSGNLAVSAVQTFTTLTAAVVPVVAAHYPFDEGAGTTTADVSGNGNPGTLQGTGGLPQWAGGMRNAALHFDGIDDSVRLSSGIVRGSALDLSGKSRTYAAWVQWNDNYTKYIVASNDGAAHVNGLFTTNDTNRGRFRLAIDGGAHPDTTVVCDTVIPSTGRWYHVAGTWNGSVARIYVDGTACNASAPGTTDYDMTGDPVHIGSSRGSTGFWRGEIDDVRIYDRALTAGEVQALYTNVDAQANQVPSVSITSVPDGLIVTEPVDLIIDANAVDSDGVVSQVQFYSGAQLLATDVTFPYSYTWVSVSPGTYAITARAIDDDGAVGISPRTDVTVRSALPAVTITATDPDLAESGSGALFTVARTGSTAASLTVAYSLSGSAVNGTDYASLSGIAVVPVGAPSVAVPVTAIDDSEVEQTESITVTVAAGQTYLASGTQVVTLYVNDDDAPATGPIVIDHTSVSLYDDIPARYLDEAKKMWLNVAGESDSRAFRNGLNFLAASNPAYAASATVAGEPEGPRADALRYSNATWGDISSPTGWVYWYGEEDWFTSELAIERTKAHIQRASDIGKPISAIGFGWCADMCRRDAGLSAIDPVHKVRFSGSSVGGPAGDRPWGLDAEDSVITGNPVSLDTYLDATRSIQAFAAASGTGTKVFFSTGPLRNECAGYPPFQEIGYQTFLKNERIRQAALNDAGAILFDFGDIMSHNDNNQLATTSFTSALISVTYPTMHPDNMFNFDGASVLLLGEDVADPDGDHIGNVGSLRIGKAAWVLMARLAGWDGRPEN